MNSSQTAGKSLADVPATSPLARRETLRKELRADCMTALRDLEDATGLALSESVLTLLMKVYDAAERDASLAK